MRFRRQRLLAAALVLGLLAPVAGAAPGGGTSRWQELWQRLAELRPASWWGLAAHPEVARAPLAREPGAGTASSVEKEGAGYDPSGRTSEPPPPPPDSSTP